MAKKKKSLESADFLSEIIIKGIQEKKGKEILSLNLKKFEYAVSDYFIVCHGTSNTQVQAIAASVEDEVFNAIGAKPWHREGMQNAEWILLDYVNVVVHIFQEDIRNFYQIEKLWAVAEIKKIED
ncbi:MAG TPA: ribosome silencing factor [Bacteroidales bacterium]|nr:ribosome silencing factor [Bacteroidales bacterium]